MTEIPDPVGLRPLVVDEDQSNKFSDLIKLVFVFELRPSAFWIDLVVIELT